MKIEVGKKYRTRDGKVATIEGISDIDGDDYPAVGRTVETGIEAWTLLGKWYADGTRSQLDLIEEVVDTMAAGAEAIGKQMRGDYTTYGEVGQVEQMRDSINATREPVFDPHQELHRVLGPGGVIHYRTPESADRLLPGLTGNFTRTVPPADEPRPDVAAITEIDRVMRGLDRKHQRFVLAWLTARVES